ARSWIGSIAPEDVVTYEEEQARNIWQSGGAAFMRNWTYAYALGANSDSPISGKFDVTVLPKGGENGNNADCLGGWNLMVSEYSRNPELAADLVRYLCSPEAQKRRTMDWSLLPTRTVLYSDPDVLAKFPFFKTMLDVFNNAVDRPSTVTGAGYNQLSTAFSKNVNKVLTGAESGKEAVIQIEVSSHFTWTASAETSLIRPSEPLLRPTSVSFIVNITGSPGEKARPGCNAVLMARALLR